MPTLIDPARFTARADALPRPAEWTAPRASTSERPAGGDRRMPTEPYERCADARSPLPRVLARARALVVDDDADTVELFAAMLTACGADVVTAGSAAEGLQALAARGVDVVVSDIAMPGRDGYWLVRQIRTLADERVSRVPVVAVTAYGREHSRARTLAAGFADHLQKPVDPDTLCRAVARAIGR